MAFNSTRTSRETSDDEGQAARAPKRQRLNDRTHASGPATTALSHGEYTVGWICALPKELSAATAMLDSIHQDLPRAENDVNTYTLGAIGAHNVAIACLPSGYYGNNNAATVASNMRRTFPRVRLCLMVGIGGGAPGKVDVRLGDVVVGEGVVQYDLGKTIGQDCFVRTSSISKPPLELLTAVAKLRATHELAGSKIPAILSAMRERHPAMVHYSCRGSLQDRLFDITYDHVQSKDVPTENCELCDTSRLVKRPPRDDLNPKIHYGTIASANQVMKHGRTRDELTRELNALCFEMEGSGVMDGFAGLVIRGICDYSDSHKNKQWQELAAAIAAAYARELLSTIPSDRPKPRPIVAVPSADIDIDRQQNILNLLKFDQIDARRLNIRPKYSTTCQWLLTQPEYLDWLNPEAAVRHRGFLWIRGGPGTGKSTIMNFAYKDSAKDKQKTTISFFFNARGEILERSIHGMYRSLLYQLLQALPHLLQVFDEPEHQASLNQLRAAVAGQEQPTWQISVLQDLLRSALANLGPNVLTVFVDALDECPIPQVEELVEFFEDVGDNAVQNQARLNICFSSRYYPQINIQYGHKIDLEDQDGHEKDIAMFIRNKLKVGTGKGADEVKAGVQAKAKGIFMWVVLVVDILKAEYSSGRIFNVKKRLASLPAELSELFKEILSRDQKNLGDLRLCIQWVLFAKRPLKLEEYYFAAVSGLCPGELQEWDPDEVTAEAMGKFVVSSSKGLAEVTKTKGQTVQFIHESVREFFHKDGLRELWPDLAVEEFESASHSHLQQCCYAYLGLTITSGMAEQLSPDPLPKASSDEAKQLRGTASSRLPFLEYATRHILYHANAARDLSSQQAFLADFPLKDWILLDNLFEIFEVRRHTPNASLLYILAEKDLANLIKYALCLNPMTEIKGERHQYPLFAALANGNRAAVKALLQTEADRLQDEVFDRLDYGSDFEVRKGQTPLLWAAAKGHADLVRLFLEQGISIHESDKSGRTPLIHAVRNGHAAVVQLLVKGGAAVNGWFSDFEKPGRGKISTPLLAAAELGDEATVKLLMENGAHIIGDGYLGWTPLLEAAKGGHEAIVRLMIEKGADLMENDESGRTPLLMAALEGHEAIVRLLIENGADIMAKDLYGETPLGLAASGGHIDTVRLLIESGADVAMKASYRPPLIETSKKGHIDIVRLLIESGADVMAKDVDGQTPLILAAGGGHEAIVRFLIEKGADVTVMDRDGWTALHRAVEKGDISVVQLLLKSGAIINTKTRRRDTAMSLAIEHGHGAIVQLLKSHQQVFASN